MDTEGKLNDDERSEYAGYVRANKFIATLKRTSQTALDFDVLMIGAKIRCGSQNALLYCM